MAFSGKAFESSRLLELRRIHDFKLSPSVIGTKPAGCTLYRITR